MHINFKKTIWERVDIPEDKEEEILEFIINSKEPVISINHKLTIDLELKWENMDDTETFLNPKDNEGFATIEVIGDHNKTIYINGKN